MLIIFMLRWSTSGISCSWAPTSTAAADQAKQKGGNKAGEYLAYPRVLRPLLSNYAFVSKGKGRLYIVDCKVEIQNKDEKLGLSKTSIFRQVLQHEVRISQQFNSMNIITMQQKLLQHCIIVSCNI